ncbi:hypothetical protein J3Q64DRAFT_1707459 [Phycomyces blakesleeanus]|uniref:Uncharacterized protein n=2 Tax=Phycomyces blakesleeanus TaxID=4837 RepID=A0A162Y083_PHYB8|nr:hypothetical protein PHYBLDRAFT_76411 [Phycomyces blakesleeanus NRRL 1555(-)]OAD77525.1 hypothetical protein PHYBLDRAFT_76411 [Phycomyces blakesleeanus NRRL 1555(-)]|eukprot:XP_018295565.1 hypothetical protein PHYBLDRAFT_76411 [Phycomyces blakesleeanus NRRL 1555(-)]
MNFSPYKPSPDEDRNNRLREERQKQKQPKGKAKQTDTSPYSSYQSGKPNYPGPSPSSLEEGLFSETDNLGGSRGPPTGTLRVNKYETSLPIRVDIEAALAYVLGPVTGLLFLVLERQNDYVRFHAWQSSMVFLALMCAHFVLMFISNFLSWTLFIFDIGLLVWLTYRAYLDGASLERYEFPYFGPIASEYVDSE